MAAEDSIYDLIANGEVDDYLDDIMSACTERRREIGRQTMASLQIGDTVRIDATHLRPRYIHGATAQVTELRVTKVTVRFPEVMDRQHDQYGKYAGKQIIVPSTALEKVEEAVAP